MAGPVYQSAGTVGDATDTTGTYTVNPTYQASIAAGDLLVYVVATDAILGGPSITAISTPSGYTLIGNNIGGTKNAAACFYKVASGSETGAAPTSTVTFIGTTSSATAQVYRFNGNATSGTIVELFGTTGPTLASTSATPPSIGATSVANELAVCLFTDENTSTTFTQISGQSGGTWTSQHTDSDATSSQTLNVQTAPLASASSTISGGTSTIGASSTWISLGFAILPFVSSAYIPIDLAHRPMFQPTLAT